jgi:hypothetical protein
MFSGPLRTDSSNQSWRVSNKIGTPDR